MIKFEISFKLNFFTPTDLNGLFQIKDNIMLFLILRVEWINKMLICSVSVFKRHDGYALKYFTSI